MWKTSKKYGLITMIDKYFSREAVCELRHPFIPMKFNIDDVPMVPFGMKMFLRLLLRFVYNRDYLVLTWFDIHAGFLALFASIVNEHLKSTISDKPSPVTVVSSIEWTFKP